MNTLLTVDNLTIEVRGTQGRVKPVDGISFHIDRGETLGLVGESGSGKSLTSLAIMRLLPPRALEMAGGTITFDGTDLATLTEKQMRRLRGKRIGMIFQEPMTALNPAFTVGFQVAEPLRTHLRWSKRQSRTRVLELLDMVGIHRPAEVADSYPHHLSGGMRQRVMIAMAMACEPVLLIADEPTTALDVTTQQQILELIAELQRTHGTAVLLVTHDLGVVARVCDRVVVMRTGHVMETGSVDDVFYRSTSPYTTALLESMPSRNVGADRLPYITEGILSS